MKTVIIVGATTGIGKALAECYAEDGWVIGAAGRRKALLEELQETLPTEVIIQEMDVADTATARLRFESLVSAAGGVDLVVITAGIGYIDPSLPWEKERETIAVNVEGFAAIAHAAFRIFMEQGYGHLAGVSSIAAIRGGASPVYNASKAFVSNYLQGIRYLAAKRGLPVYVTDIQPGFVDTAMAQGDRLFWVASPEKAARQIFKALERRRPHVYITRRWRLIGWLLKVLPEPLYHKL